MQISRYRILFHGMHLVITSEATGPGSMGTHEILLMMFDLVSEGTCIAHISSQLFLKLLLKPFWFAVILYVAQSTGAKMIPVG